jgi:hypothetical protein
MPRYYWTAEFEDPRVFHSEDACPIGQRIAPENRVEIDTTPAGRIPCEQCLEMKSAR